MRSIRQLSPGTQASLQASLVAVTLDDICAILLRHALAELAANTRKPAVTFSLDYEAWSLTVKHNGSASDADLDVLSYLGILHTRACTRATDTTRIVQNGEVVYAGPSPDVNASSGPMRMLEDGRGAVVCLRDIFHSLPVRRSFLSADTQKKKQNETLVETLRKLSLVQPRVTFRLMVSSAFREPKTLLTLGPATDIVERFRQAYGRESIDKDSVRAFASEAALRSPGTKNKSPTRSAVRLKLHGFVSLSVAPKPPQILLINGYNWTDLESSKHAHMSEFDNEHIAPYLDLTGATSSSGRPQTDLYTLIENRIDCVSSAAAATKGLQHAFAIIANLKHASDEVVESGTDSDSSFKAALLNAIHDPSKPACTSREKTDDTISTSSVASIEYIGAKRPKTAPTAPASNADALPRRPQTAALGNARHACYDVRPPPGMTTWTQPGTDRLFFIDTQTGQSFGPIDRGADHSDFTRSKDKAGIVDRSKLRKKPSDSNGQRAPAWLSATLEGWKNPAFGDNGTAILAPLPASEPSEFDDPELDAALASLPSTPRRSKRLAPVPHRSSRFFGEREVSTANGSLEHSMSEQVEKTAIDVAAELPISRTDLATAQVLNQVDEKFVLCTVIPDGSDSPVLVCFDQHAMDERYRLEQLLQDYVATCHGPAHGPAGDTPITVSINRKEYDLLADKDANSTANAVQASLAFLGFHLVGLVLIHEGLGHAQVDLACIPEILRDRVVSLTGRVHNPELLSSVFRAVVSELVTRPVPPSVLERDEPDALDPSSWLTTTRHIPPSLMDLFCSKACRSAIMFNDPLSKAACEALISRLALCQFPFQCAHGRPTLVPLCRI